MNEVSNEFEKLVLNELAKTWRALAYKFGWLKSSAILAPMFKIFDRQDRWGEWDPNTREMSFSRTLVTTRPWGEVIEVLKHEMAHQYVSEVLKVTDEPPHGKTFFLVCKNNGIDAAVRGAPGADKLTTTNHIVEKIRSLLDKSVEKGATEEEAKTAAELAHKLMLKYNIELQEKNEELGYSVAYVGGITGRIQAYMSDIASLLSKYYFVQVIWMNIRDPRTQKDGHELELSGTSDNLEVAEYVYTFLSRAAIEAWEKKFASPEFKDRMKQDLASPWLHPGAPTSPRGYAISARSNFLHGFIQGFASQLKKAEVEEQQAGLVLAKDAALEAFYRTRHPHIINRGGSQGYYNPNWKGAGFNEGKELKIPPAAKAAKNFTPLLGK